MKELSLLLITAVATAFATGALLLPVTMPGAVFADPPAKQAPPPEELPTACLCHLPQPTE
jgi:hypothetical protein